MVGHAHNMLRDVIHENEKGLDNIIIKVAGKDREQNGDHFIPFENKVEILYSLAFELGPRSCKSLESVTYQE